MAAAAINHIRPGYNPTPVEGTRIVADSEPQRFPPALRCGFAVSHHPGHVTVHLGSDTMTAAEALSFGLAVVHASDLARIEGAA